MVNKIITITFLACIFCSELKAQNKEHKWLNIGLLTSAVVFNAVGDGLNSKEHYATGHVFNAASMASLIAIPVFSSVNKNSRLSFISSYVLIRYALFDQIYNASAKNPINYEGGDNYYDRTVVRLPQNVIYGTKILSLGLIFYIN